MIELDDQGYFITGSDTDAGKTYVGCQVVRQLVAAGIGLEIRKPAESGCRPGADGDLITQDAAALRAANGERETIERIAPFRLRAALAPHRAARLEQREIRLQQLVDACVRDEQANRLVVEGAGGFLSPLAEDGLNADLAAALSLPTIVVVRDRIGAVNQALMTVEAITQRGLEVAAVILNRVDADIEADMDNAADLRQWCNRPVFSCAHAEALPPLFMLRR